MGRGFVHFPLLPALSSPLFFLDVVSADVAVVVGLVNLFVVVGLLVSATVSTVTVVDLFVTSGFVSYVVVAAAAFLFLFGAEAVDGTAFQAMASPGVVVAVWPLTGGGRT